MKLDQIKAVWKKVPFRPFALLTGSGERYPVNHPEALSHTPSGRTVSIWLDEYEQVVIDVESINEFIVGPSPKRRRARATPQES
jgi:hypothetical protein